MDERESTRILESLYPVGEERWIKVKYLDFEWCAQHLRCIPKKEDDEKNEIGFEVTAVSVREDYTPQVEALDFVKDELFKSLEYMLDPTPEKVLEMAKHHIEEAKARIINDSIIGIDYSEKTVELPTCIHCGKVFEIIRMKGNKATTRCPNGCR